MPEMRYTPSGKPVASFSIIATHSWRSSDGTPQQDTDWFNVVAWGELAETCKQSLNKGQLVYLEGRIKNRCWLDDTDAIRSCAEIVAQSVVALDTSHSADAGPAQA
jgi:single-strand DNA-binding protein